MKIIRTFSVVRLALCVLALTACSVPETKTRAKGSGGAPIPLGELDAALLKEASGLAVSRRVNDRLYHVNDSGDGPYIYQTAYSGDYTRRIQIDGFDPQDAEDLAYGPCGDKTCIVVADVGDNKKNRENVELVFVEETDKLPGLVKPKGKFLMKYPNGPHNVEGVALHPSGDLFFVTKEIDHKNFKTGVATIFRLARSQWEPVVLGRAARDLGTKARPLIPEVWGQLDLPVLLKDAGYMGQGVTSLDIASNGQKFLVLTYVDAVEFQFDLSRARFPGIDKLRVGQDYRVISMVSLDQQEAAAYLPDGSGFIYTTEIPESADFRRSAIMQIDLAPFPR